jgi:DNA-binding NarL/FixJ family response regulator
VISTLQATRTIVIQDRSRLYRESLQLVLPSMIAVQGVGVVPDIESLLRACSPGGIDAVVLEMVDVPWNVVELILELRRLLVQPVLVGTYSPHQHPLRPVNGVALVCRTSSCRAVARALDGSSAEEVTVSTKGVNHSGNASHTLTRREFQVLALISGGSTTAQIATRLGLSVKTVENRMQSLYGKLNVQNRSSAIAVAMGSGLLGISSGFRGAG